MVRRCALLCVAGFVLTALTQAGASVQVPGAAEGQAQAQQHYDEAFQFQDEGQLAQADEEHKLFLAAALHHIANARGNVGDYARAVPLYDEAVKFTPTDTALRMDYASAALDGLDWKSAETQSSAVVDILKSKGEPASVAAVSLLAQSMMAAGDLKNAVEQFKLAAELKPGFDTSYALAGAYLAMGKKAEAEMIFALMPAQYGDGAELHMRIGRLYGQAAFWDEAIREFRTAIAKDPDLPGAHFSLGATLVMRSGEPSYAEAEPELRRELEINPSEPLAYIALGRIEVVQRRFSEAEADLKHAVQLDDQNTAAYALLGQVYSDLGKDAEAKAAFRKQIELTLVPAKNDFEVQRAHFNLGRLLARDGDVPEGHREMDVSRDMLHEKEQQLEARLRGDPTLQLQVSKTRIASPEEIESEKRVESQVAPMMASSYDNLGVHAAVAGNLAAATDYFSQAAQWNPDLPGIDRKWGRAAFSAGEFSAAVEPLTRALAAHPDDDKARTMLATSLFATHNYAATVRVLQPMEADLGADRSLQLAYFGSLAINGDAAGMARLTEIEQADPESAEAHRLLGEAYAARRQCVQARKELDTALSLDPSMTAATHALALNDLADGNKAEARKLLADLAKSGSKDADVHYRLAQLQMEAGAREAAMQSMETAVWLSPQNPTYHRELAETYRINERTQDEERELEKSSALESAQGAPAGLPQMF
jgi:tetratricopeptide (TPR) repeat protein